MTNDAAPETRRRRQGWRILFLTVFLIFSAILASLLSIKKQPDPGTGPLYKGKTVRDWIDSIQMANSEDTAVRTLVEIGEPAVPCLVRAAEWRASLLHRIGRIGWQHAGSVARWLRLPHPVQTIHKNTVRRGAMYALALIGPPAKDALPSLRQIARGNDWEFSTFALSAIASIGPEEKDVHLLVAALRDAHPNVRIQAARGLAKLGVKAKEAAGLLRKALQDENEAVRRFASEAISKIDPDFAGPPAKKPE
ncbi:MAG: hypothetical protein DME18_01435 [Verrucomicrobia bacterium]|nr:MAG: hypothetical protein DME18_01435 [Verrucomicrobiota bacterium]